MRSSVGLWLLVAVLLSCSKPKDDPAAARDCGERADALGAELGRYADEIPSVSWFPNPMPESDVGQPADARGPIILIDDGEVRYNGSSMGEGGEELGERHRAELRVRQQIGHGASVPLYVHASPATTVARLSAVLQRVEGERTARLLVWAQREARTNPLASAPPRVLKVLDELHGGDPAQRAARIAEVVEKSIGTCAPIVELFGTVAAVDASKKGRVIADNIAASLRGCDCKVADLDMFEYAMLAVMDVGNTVQRYVPLSLTGEGTAIELPGTATVAELIDQLEARPAEVVNAGISLQLAAVP